MHWWFFHHLVRIWQFFVCRNWVTLITPVKYSPIWTERTAMILTNFVRPELYFNLITSTKLKYFISLPIQKCNDFSADTNEETNKKLTLQILLWYDYQLPYTKIHQIQNAIFLLMCAHFLSSWFFYFFVFVCVSVSYAIHNFSFESKADFMHAKELLSIERKINGLVAFFFYSCPDIICQKTFLVQLYPNTVAE